MIVVYHATYGHDAFMLALQLKCTDLDTRASFYVFNVGVEDVEVRIALVSRYRSCMIEGGQL